MKISIRPLEKSEKPSRNIFAAAVVVKPRNNKIQSE